MSFAEGTSVPVERSRAEIERTLLKYGADRFACGWDGDRAAINFTSNGRMIRFVLALPTLAEGKEKVPRKYSWQAPTDAKVQAWKDGETRRRWRCLLLAIKSKLECVETGIETFDEAFLSHIVTEGNITMYERLQIEDNGVRMLAPPEGTP